MADNLGRPRPCQWDDSLPIGMYAMEGGEMCPYRYQAHSHRVERLWQHEGIDVSFDDAENPDFSKGHLVALPGVVDLDDEDLRTDEEMTRSFGKGLLDFERAAMSLKGLFEAYAEAYDANKAAVERMSSDAGSAGAAKTAYEASKRRMALAKERYSETLSSVLEYSDWAFAGNKESMVRVTLHGRNGQTLDGYPAIDDRDHDEVARVFTFGTDEEVAELRRSIEICSMWCNGHTILDVTKGAELIAQTWPERRSESADLICDAVHRDMVRMLHVIRGNGMSRRRLEGHWGDADRFVKDVSGWCNDALLALDCAWLMDPSMMPPVETADTIASIRDSMDSAHLALARSILSQNGSRWYDEVAHHCEVAVNAIKRHVGKFESVWSDTRPMRKPIGGEVPVERLEMLAKVVSSGDAIATRRGPKGYITFGERSLLMGDVEAATVAYVARRIFLGEIGDVDVDAYTAMVRERARETVSANARSAIDADISSRSEEDEVTYDG